MVAQSDRSQQASLLNRSHSRVRLASTLKNALGSSNKVFFTLP